MTDVEFIVYGQPAPQGSKRHVGGGVMIESSKYVAPWRESVKHAARLLMDLSPDAPWPLTGPLEVRMIFTMRAPKTLKRGVVYCHKRPDTSKLIRSTEDALTDAGFWGDDAQVSDIRGVKVYEGRGENLGGLHIPGVKIMVTLLPEVLA